MLAEREGEKGDSQGQVQCTWHSVKFVNIHYNLRLMTFKAAAATRPPAQDADALSKCQTILWALNVASPVLGKGPGMGMK